MNGAARGRRASTGPTKRLTFRCCLIHLKNSSICHRDLYTSAIVFVTQVVLFARNT